MENTPNIGLKRWEGGDRILHSEFNDNWDKIDAALDSKVPMTVLHDITLTEDKSQLQFDMGGEGWSNHSMILITYTPPENPSGGVIDVSSFSGETYMDIGRSDTTKKTVLPDSAPSLA